MGQRAIPDPQALTRAEAGVLAIITEMRGRGFLRVRGWDGKNAFTRRTRIAVIGRTVYAKQKLQQTRSARHLWDSKLFSLKNDRSQ